MKIIATTMVLATVLLCTAAHAQGATREKPSPSERTDQRTEEMTKELGLNEDQAAKLKAMNGRYAEELRMTRPSDEEREAKRQKMKDIQTRRDAELKTLLTEEQYAKMMELRQQRRDAHKGERGDKRSKRAE